MATAHSTHPLATVPQRPHAPLIADRSLVAFFGLAFGLSWALWLVAILGATGPAASLAELGALFGPAVAAAVVSWRVGGLRDWAAGMVHWRAPVRWWALALGLPLAYVAVWHLGLLLVGSDALDVSLLTTKAVSYVPLLLVMSLVGGGLNEEPGWRGFALPRLQQRLSPMRATLVLGVVWAVWHVPAYVLVAQAGHGLATAQMTMVLVGSAIEPVAWAVVFTWLYNHTNSTLLCILLHGGINAAFASLLLPAAALQGDVYLQVALVGNAVVAAGAVALVVATRGRLGQRVAPPVLRRGGSRNDDQTPEGEPEQAGRVAGTRGFREGGALRDLAAPPAPDVGRDRRGDRPHVSR